MRRKKIKTEIFKIQKPLVSNLATPEVLAYNKDRSIEVFVPMDSKDIEALFEDDLKQYWEGHLARSMGGTHLVLDRQVGDEDW